MMVITTSVRDIEVKSDSIPRLHYVYSSTPEYNHYSTGDQARRELDGLLAKNIIDETTHTQATALFDGEYDLTERHT